MKIDLYLVGIGTGNPEHVTQQAINVLRSSDIILVPNKGSEKSDLANLRYQICDELLGSKKPPIFEFDIPKRSSEVEYLEAVDQWHEVIANAWESTIEHAQLNAVQRIKKVSLMIWGDPSLYDSALRIAERLTPKPSVTVVPGITSIQALASAHKIPINDVGSSFLVTTGRRLIDEGFPKDYDKVVVMLDGNCSFNSLIRSDFYIWWGAYLGMPNQIIFSGNLDDVADLIVKERKKARDEHGWIMDTYLIKKC